MIILSIVAGLCRYLGEASWEAGPECGRGGGRGRGEGEELFAITEGAVWWRRERDVGGGERVAHGAFHLHRPNNGNGRDGNQWKTGENKS